MGNAASELRRLAGDFAHTAARYTTEDLKSRYLAGVCSGLRTCAHDARARAAELDNHANSSREGSGMRGKLVRDRIPEVIRKAGRVPVIEIATPEDYPRYVRAKLQEELGEYLSSGDVGELADLVEACFAAAALRGVSQGQLLAIARDKRVHRGGFDDRLVWMGNLLNGDATPDEYPRTSRRRAAELDQQPGGHNEKTITTQGGRVMTGNHRISATIERCASAEGDPRYRAICGCGYQGASWKNRADARQDLERHVQ